MKNTHLHKNKHKQTSNFSLNLRNTRGIKNKGKKCLKSFKRTLECEKNLCYTILHIQTAIEIYFNLYYDIIS